MNELLLLGLSLSLSGSLVAFALILLKPLLRQFSKTWQFYLWLLVILRLLVPFSPDGNVVEGLFLQAEPYFAAQQMAPKDLAQANRVALTETPRAPASEKDGLQTSPISDSDFLNAESPIWGAVWLSVAMLLLIRKVYGYAQFTTAVKKESTIVLDGQLPAVLSRVKTELNIQKHIAVCTNPHVRAPMLTGVIRPWIVLPTRAFSAAELAHIFRHELTHYRRMDILYKWLVEIAVCIHWFNPFVYWIRKQINRDCELSCDEVAISRLDASEREGYGETLLNSIVIKNAGRADSLFLSLSEDGTLIKKRLRAIIQYQKTPKRIVFLASVLTAILLAGTVYAGAYTTTSVKHTDAVVYECVEMRRYEGDSGHPYIHNVRINNTDSKIVGGQRGMLAFDKDGNPLKIDWWSLDTKSDSAYFYLYDEDSADIAPGETYDVRGGWSLNSFKTDLLVDRIAYVLYCDKEITFEDGTIWKNPQFETWLATYEGKQTAVDVLENYYPYVQELTSNLSGGPD